MARINKDGDATPKAPRRRTTTAPAPDPSERVEVKRPEAATAAAARPEPPEVPKRPALVATMPAHHTPANAEEEIRRRAYELYEQEGRQHGRDREHWLRAEAEVLGRKARGQKSA